jgi:progressive ankylosis protein
MNSNTKTEELTNSKIFKFWLPLAATWLMMSMEGPFIAAIIARLPEPKFNLAAFGVAFSFALVIEAPVIMIMSASTALVKDCFSFKKLRNFTYIINGVITALMIVFLIPSIFDYITIDLISLPKKVSDLTYIACIILLPWPGTIGYRRFYQGIMIRYNYTRRVAYGTVIRLVMMSATALILYVFYKFDGVIVGASALTVGVTSEAIASKIMSLKILKSIKERESGENKIGYKEIIKFYYPLALTSLLGLGVHPFVTFFIGQSRMAIESLAILPVVNSLVFIFRSTGLSFQEVGIALFGEKGEGFIPLRNFALRLAVISTGLLMIISFTPLAKIWFHDISGLSIELTEFAILPLIIISIMPALSVLISFQRSILVANKNTSPITPATAIEVIGILLVLFLLINGFYLVGAVAAMTAFIIGRIGSIIYLIPPFLRISNNIRKKQSNL